MTDIVVRAEDLGKRYRIGQMRGAYRTLRDALGEKARTSLQRLRREQEETIWALRHASFEVRRGQVLGIIGRNGAGKSTLLKLLSRVTEPSEGRAEIRGRVGSLLEVGTGFHPELTGRENIYLNGAILGMKRLEIARKFDEIVGFAEVTKFIDTPVKRYSSGMYLRLAFAVAAHLEPEILVVDEVLAVGDAEFQRKCLGKMSDVAQEGRTVLFVSHNMSAIQRLTQESLVLENGQIVLRAPTGEAIDHYLSAGLNQSGERIWEDDARLSSAAPFRPLSLRVVDARGRQAETVLAAEPFCVEMAYELQAEVTGLRVGLYVTTSRGDPVLTSFDTDDPARFVEVTARQPGRYVSRCHFPANLFNEGRYLLGVNASSFKIRSYFTDEHALILTVDGTGAVGSQWPEPRSGVVRPSLEWDLEGPPA
jgi:lipopolysaccharide transport system ATP-binding protein